MTNQTTPKIGSGIYLVIDPSMDEATLFYKLSLCLQENLAAVQIWDNFKAETDKQKLIYKICTLCHAKNVPVLINNQWELVPNSLLNGVHFDCIPEHFEAIKKTLNTTFICGLTCNNDLEFVRWASENKLDYVSFCSVFPSSTANSCELVNFSTIEEASKRFSIPIFLAGGIQPENMKQLEGLSYTGIAVISGIMSADQPQESIKKYQQALTNQSII